MNTFEIREDPLKERGGTEVRAQSAIGGTRPTVYERRGSKDPETKDSVESPTFTRPIMKAQIQLAREFDLDDAGQVDSLYRGQTFEQWLYKKDH